MSNNQATLPSVVYLLEVGCYDEAYIKGVYASPEAAIAAHTPNRSSGHEWSGPDEQGCYSFSGEWNDHASVRPYEVES